jgi:hypothetical protein
MIPKRGKWTNQKFSQTPHKFDFIFAIGLLMGTHIAESYRNIKINPYNLATRHKHILWVNIAVVDKGIVNLL